MLACRACRIALTSADGCAICADYKRNLVSTDEMEELVPSLAEVGAEAVAALRAQVKWLKDALDLKKGGNPADGLLRKDLSLIVNAVAKTLEAARKLQDDGISAVSNMNAKERAKLFVGWYASLAPNQRLELREQMEKFENDISQPLLEA